MTAVHVDEQRVCLLTGANGGIGRAVARKLLSRGVKVLLVCRDRNKGQALIDELQAEFPAERMRLLIADLSLLDDVRRLATEVREQTDRLDIIIHNAGIFDTRRTVTRDGFEIMLAVNYLAPFLLTHLLLEPLRKAANVAGEARVLHVSSSVYRLAKIDARNLNVTSGFRAIPRYAQTKLAILMFAMELAERLRGTGITSLALHPGLTNTPIMEKHSSPLFSLPSRLARRFIRTPEQSAEGYVKLALSPELRGVTGRYFVNGVEEPVQPFVRDPAENHRLWKLSDDLTRVPIADQLPPTTTNAEPQQLQAPFQLTPLIRSVLSIGALYHGVVAFGLMFAPQWFASAFGIHAAGWGVPAFMTVLTMLWLALGYAIAARKPVERKALVRITLLVKTCESALLLWYGPAALWSWWLIAFDVGWWLALVGALRQMRKADGARESAQLSAGAISELADQNGRTLQELSRERPVLVLCVRHTGCAFCREAMSDLGRLKPQMERDGLGLAVVHMSPDAVAAEMCERYGLGDVSRIRDPQRRLYRAFKLPLGGLPQLLPLAVWHRGVQAAMLAGHGIGKIIGNVRQLAGAAVVWRGDVVSVSRAATACDRLDLDTLGTQAGERCGVVPSAESRDRQPVAT